ncbi:DL-methionine transporter subunit; membrane component protein of ABC superfamily [uncultured Eubacteriales bacterium]|uniref:DL-methionine transporter subunit membrane component protein of ABC superfamily n=1 Tax=uncultured Eubacteriales bacterium TaxID=172733 RepID=A0A212JC69_9FIRM|nr:DL-methionine transporter subunit; membrane component protein of ABC superfamily [uncultured Eubacteriales bacterium]
MKEKLFGVTIEKLLLSGGQTLYMVGWGMLIGGVIGTVLALLLVLCRKGGLAENRVVYFVLENFINIVRSVPFIILLVTIMPLTRAIIGTTIGSKAALVPLIFYISPYMARLVENSLLEVSPGILEAAQAMGATNFQIVRYFLLPETLGSIVLALTTGTVGLLGASAMAGYSGGGGVGNLALTYGYEKFNTPLMIFTVVILIVFVQLLQAVGGHLSRRLRAHR